MTYRQERRIAQCAKREERKQARLVEATLAGTPMCQCGSVARWLFELGSYSPREPLCGYCAQRVPLYCRTNTTAIVWAKHIPTGVVVYLTIADFSRPYHTMGAWERRIIKKIRDDERLTSGKGHRPKAG